MSINQRFTAAGLSGVPQTMLWPLYNRAAESLRPDGLLHDPLAVRIADSVDYDYASSFGRPDLGHVIRALVIDSLLRDWVRAHPGGQVVALGEGLETQFHRVDDGWVHWLSVDLPEAIEVRARYLPDTDRHRNLACSALDRRWMDEVDASRGVYITAAGLLMYFQPDEVHGLIAAVAGRFPAAEMAFDVIPRWLARKSLRGWRVTPHYTTPPMPWGLDRNEVGGVRDWHPNIADVRVVTSHGGRGFFYRVVVPVIRSTPWLRNKMPSVVRLRCRPVPAGVAGPQPHPVAHGVQLTGP
jgi:O-methyltransferase involved in polyketide biosynthesis